MLRNLMLSIVIAVGLVALFGWMVDEVWHIQVLSNGMVTEPLEVLVGLAIGAVIMVIVGLLVTISILSAIAFAFFIVVAVLAFTGLTIGWPFILAALAVWFIVKDKKTAAH